MGPAGDASPPAYTGYKDRVIGALIGCMCGDMLGCPVEGWVPQRIFGTFPDGLVDIISHDGIMLPIYTDDTVLTIALTKSLLEVGRADAVNSAGHYARMYNPFRGFGGGARKILEALRRGADPLTVGGLFLPGGSFGNGGAMRIAPVGLLYRNAVATELLSAVEAALLCTHTHPVGIDGALIQAAAVAWLCKADGASATPEALLDHLAPLARTPEMTEALAKLAAALPAIQKLPQHQVPVTNYSAFFRSPDWSAELALAAEVAVEPHFQIKASDAAATALLALLCHWRSPESCLIAAVHYGGDTDTIAAMAGALCGALYGVGWVPGRWWGRLEQGPDGRDALVALGERLAELEIAPVV